MGLGRVVGRGGIGRSSGMGRKADGFIEDKSGWGGNSIALRLWQVARHSQPQACAVNVHNHLLGQVNQFSIG